MNVRIFNQAVREQVLQLQRDGYSDFLYVTSIENRQLGSTTGRVAEVSLEQAGKLLAEKTHRVSSPQEISGFKTACEARRREILAGSLLRLPPTFRAGLRK